MPSEIWKKVQGYSKFYEVSNLGRVRSLDRKTGHGKGKFKRKLKGRILNQTINKNGYPYVSLSKKGIVKKYFISWLVAEAFIEKRPKGKECNHIDGNKSNNHVNNLEWVTRAENNYHKENILGLHNRGERQGLAKLTNDKIVKIIRLYKTGKFTQKELGAIFNISRGHVSDIILRKVWKHIKI